MPLELFSCALVAKGAFRAGATGSSAPPINQYKEQETKKGGKSTLANSF